MMKAETSGAAPPRVRARGGGWSRRLASWSSGVKSPGASNFDGEDEERLLDDDDLLRLVGAGQPGGRSGGSDGGAAAAAA